MTTAELREDKRQDDAAMTKAEIIVAGMTDEQVRDACRDMVVMIDWKKGHEPDSVEWIRLRRTLLTFTITVRIKDGTWDQPEKKGCPACGVGPLELCPDCDRRGYGEGSVPE